MTDNEIKKALECCSEEDKCKECPYYNKGNFKCLNYKFFKDLLDLINRLQADVENYKQVAEYQQSVTMDRGFKIKRLKEEIERLRYNLIAVLEERADYTEAYIECIEKVKEKACKLNMRHNGVVLKTDYQISGEELYNLLKEMVGEQK